MDALNFVVVVVLVVMVISTIAKMIVETLATFEGIIGFFLFITAMIVLVAATNGF